MRDEITPEQMAERLRLLRRVAGLLIGLAWVGLALFDYVGPTWRDLLLLGGAGLMALVPGEKWTRRLASAAMLIGAGVTLVFVGEQLSMLQQILYGTGWIFGVLALTNPGRQEQTKVSQGILLFIVFLPTQIPVAGFTGATFFAAMMAALFPHFGYHSKPNKKRKRGTPEQRIAALRDPVPTRNVRAPGST